MTTEPPRRDAPSDTIDLRATAYNLRAQAAAYELRGTMSRLPWEAIAAHLYRAAIVADEAADREEERAGIRLPLRQRVVVIMEGVAPCR